MHNAVSILQAMLRFRTFPTSAQLRGTARSTSKAVLTFLRMHGY